MKHIKIKIKLSNLIHFFIYSLIYFILMNWYINYLIVIISEIIILYLNLMFWIYYFENKSLKNQIKCLQEFKKSENENGKAN